MRQLLIVLTIIIVSEQLFSQAPIPFAVNFDEYRPKNSLITIGDNPNLMRKTLNTEFSNLLTGQTQNSIGNFASLDITDPKVSFAGNLLSKKGSVLTVKASGGISDGFFSIFNNSSLNTNVSLDIQYNFLSLGKKSLSTDLALENKYTQSIDKIKYDYDVARWAVARDQEKTALQKRSVSTDKGITSLIAKIDVTDDGSEKDSLIYELGVQKILSDSLHKNVADFPKTLTALHALHDKTVDLLDSLAFEPAVVGFSFGWFSVGYKVTNNAFKYLDPALAFDKQVTDESSVNQEIRLQYSYYKLDPDSYKSFFLDIGMSYTNGDNFTSLTKTGISEGTEFGATPGSRKGTSTYDAYTGTYNRRLSGITGYTDLYYFLFNKNIGAIHLNPSWVTQEKEKPVANLSVGFLLAFKSGKTDVPIVNAELYYKFLDVFKTTDLDHRLFERNSVGIRFTFPIQFKYKLN